MCSKTLPVKCIIQSDFDLLVFDIARGLASLVLTKRNAASGNEIVAPAKGYAQKNCAERFSALKLKIVSHLISPAGISLSL